PDRDHRPLRAVVGEAVPHLALGCLASRALGGARHSLLAQEDNRCLHVAARLLERLLAAHHARACPFTQLLDEARRDLSHQRPRPPPPPVPRSPVPPPA